MNVHIETDRLIIRALQHTDVQGMYEMDSDAEVHKYLGRAPVTTIEQAAEMIDFINQQYATNGIGRWAVIDKATNDFLGWTGFKLMKEVANGHTGHYDFGYRYKRSAWGRGVATEAARASLHYGLHTMGLKQVYAMTDINNAASRHILEKLGFRFERFSNTMARRHGAHKETLWPHGISWVKKMNGNDIGINIINFRWRHLDARQRAVR